MSIAWYVTPYPQVSCGCKSQDSSGTSTKLEVVFSWHLVITNRIKNNDGYENDHNDDNNYDDENHENVENDDNHDNEDNDNDLTLLAPPQ